MLQLAAFVWRTRRASFSCAVMESAPPAVELSEFATCVENPFKSVLICIDQKILFKKICVLMAIK